MLGLFELHKFAEARGDGLRPELLQLLRQASPGAENVVQLAAFRGGSERQAGPTPVGRLPEELPPNVVMFRPNGSPAGHEPAERASRRRKASRASSLSRRKP